MRLGLRSFGALRPVPYVFFSEGVGIIGADGQESDFRAASLADVSKAAEVCSVAGVIDSAALMGEDKAAKAPVFIVQ